MNTDKRQCLVFGDRLLEKYVLTDLDSQFKSLPLEQFYVAIARFSGPIACLYLKVEGKQYTLPNKYDSHLLIFNTQGKEAKQIPFDLK